MNNLENANEVLNNLQNLLSTFDGRVGECKKKYEEVEKFVAKHFVSTTKKHKSLLLEVLDRYSSCATDNEIEVELGDEERNFIELLRKAPKKVDKIAYLPGKLFANLSGIVRSYSLAFGIFRNGLAQRAQQAQADREAVLRRIPFHRRFQ